MRDGTPTRADSTALQRRTLLQAVGGVLAAGGLAGCAGVTDGDGASSTSSPGGSPTATPIPVGPRPGYANWVAASDLADVTETGEPFTLIRTDLATLATLSDDESASPVPTPDPDDEGGVLLLTPLVSAVAFVLLAGFGLLPYGRLTQAMFADFGEGADESPHEVAAGLLVDEAIVFTGAFDTAELGAVSGFERADERDGFAVYEGVERETSIFDTASLAYAVRDDAVVMAIPPGDGDPFETTTPTPTPTPTPAPGEPTYGRAVVDARLDAFSGRVERAVEADPDFDWVLRAGGGQAFAFASYGGQATDPAVGPDAEPVGPTPTGPLDDQLAVLEDARALANSMSVLEGGDRATSALGAVYESAEAVPERERFEALVEGADTSTVAIEGPRVLVRGAWDDLGLDDTPSGGSV